MEPRRDILTVAQVAEDMQVTRGAILDAINHGGLRAKKFGNRVGYRIRREDYEEREATPTPPVAKPTLGRR